MFRRPLFFLVFAFPGAFAMCQNMELSFGTMTLSEGTSMRIAGATAFTIGPGAGLINNGLIDLGTATVLVEQVGAPVTGSGLERAGTLEVGPFTAIEPGGLGLSASCTEAVGPLTIERSHSTILLPNGAPSIARWFRIQSPTSSGADLALTLRYDPTELNGLDANSLSLFEASDELGPWSALTSTNLPVQFQVSATDQAPWALVTAFDQNALSSSFDLEVTQGFQAWPTMVEDVIYIVPPLLETIASLEVFDGLGRSIVTKRGVGGTGRTALELGELASGTYYLRVNGGQMIKFRKS